jgi:chemotaxis response regulator CheB
MNKGEYMNMVMQSVNEKRERMHLEVSLTVSQFELNGGKVTVCKPQRNPKSRKVSAKSKLVFNTQEPVNRPSNAWDVLLTS